MLTISDAPADQQDPAVHAVFAALDQVGGEAPPDEVTEKLLLQLHAAGGTWDDFDLLDIEGVLEPWAHRMWPIISGQRRPAHVAPEPAYGARLHPADLQTGPTDVVEDQQLSEPEPRVIRAFRRKPGGSDVAEPGEMEGETPTLGPILDEFVLEPVDEPSTDSGPTEVQLRIAAADAEHERQRVDEIPAEPAVEDEQSVGSAPAKKRSRRK